jgi:alkylated DNA repair dioxygenase AlkB
VPGKRATVTAPPEGLVHAPELLSGEEERSVLAALAELPLQEVRMRGQVARRTVRHFGLDYGYESYSLAPTDPLPAFLAPLRDRAATLAGIADPDELAQTLVSRYPPGAGIGWHRDAPMFGTVVGVSLLAPARMLLRRPVDEGHEVYELRLEPRSAYVLAGPARTAWQHSVRPVDALRWSITFRTLRNPARWRR